MFLSFSLLYLCIYAQNNDELSSAILIECGSEIESSTVGYSSDQTILTTYGLNNCGTSVDAASGVWYYLDGIDDDVKSKFIASIDPAAFKTLHVVYAKTTLSQPVGQQFVCIDETALYRSSITIHAF